MKMILAGAALAVIVLAMGAGVLLHGDESAAQVTVAIGVDADPTGNTATSLGSIDSCISVSSGETFQVDVFVTEVADLLAWETYLTYDRTIVDILDRDVMMFQAANPGSEVFDASEGLPNIDDWYRVAAVDLAEPPAPDSGSGVLARLTLKAIGAGVSPASLSPIDFDGDGSAELGPFLNDTQGDLIADADGDGFFDGPISDAQIAVDTDCPGGTPATTAVTTSTPAPASPSPSTPATPAAETPDIPPATETPAAATGTPTATAQPGTPTADGSGPADDDESAWTSVAAIIGYVVGGLAVLLLAGIGLFGIRRGRAR